jgi:hypothetical protein
MLRQQVTNCRKNGFDAEDKGFQAPAVDGRDIEVTVSETSDRLQCGSVCSGWKNVVLNCLSKHSGKCTDPFLWQDRGCVSVDI